MKTRKHRVTLLGVLMSCGLAAVTFATDPEQQGPSDEEMAAFIEATSPGEHHEALDVHVGSWDVQISMWNSPEQPEPMMSSGSAEFKWILGGRYIQQDYQGSFMGMDFQGMGLAGYDNAAGHYVSIWVDNMSTGFMQETGTYDGDSKVFTFEGSYTDPMSGAESATLSRIDVSDPDRMVVVTEGEGPGGEMYTMMKLVYTRK